MLYFLISFFMILFSIFLLNAWTQTCPSVEIVSQHVIQDEKLNEISGIVWQKENLFLVHNDSGDGSFIYQINQNGEMLQSLSLPMITPRDWEDISLMQWGDSEILFIADTGDNKEKHGTYPIHIVHLSSEKELAYESITTIHVNYGDIGPQDAEGIAVDPTTQDIFILTKGRSGTAHLLIKKAPHVHNEYAEAKRIHSFIIPTVDGLNFYRFTALDISKDGNSLVWRDYQTGYLLQKEIHDRWEDVFQRDVNKKNTICPLALPIQPQGESISFGLSAQMMYTVSEKKHQPLYVLKLIYNPVVFP